MAAAVGFKHPPKSSVEVKERVEIYLCSSYVPSWQVVGRSLPCTWQGLLASLLLSLSGKVAFCWSVFERTKHVTIAGARQDVPSPRKFSCRRVSIVWTAVSGQALSWRNAAPCVTIPHRVVRIRGLNLPRCISPNTHGLQLCSSVGSGQELVLVGTGELSTSHLCSDFYNFLKNIYYYFCFLFFLFCTLCFLRCFCIFCVLFLLLWCLFPIFIQVYRPLPPGGNPAAVSKYHIS